MSIFELFFMAVDFDRAKCKTHAQGLNGYQHVTSTCSFMFAQTFAWQATLWHCQILLASRTTLSCPIRAPGIARPKGLRKARLSLVCGTHIHISEVAIMTQHVPTIIHSMLQFFSQRSCTIYFLSLSHPSWRIFHHIFPCVLPAAAKVNALCKW